MLYFENGKLFYRMYSIDTTATPNKYEIIAEKEIME